MMESAILPVTGKENGAGLSMTTVGTVKNAAGMTVKMLAIEDAGTTRIGTGISAGIIH